MERMDAALTQLLQPPSTGPVASIFTAAHRPVPAFESGACERTLIRKGWGTGAKGEARSKLLRDAEAVMEEREAEERDKEEVGRGYEQSVSGYKWPMTCSRSMSAVSMSWQTCWMLYL
jgi:hypothetical protein